MTSFTVPKGDPDALRRVVDSVSTLSSTVGETRGDRLASLGGRAEGALPAARVAAFAGARADAVKATGAVGLSLVTVGGAIADWAEALETTQDTVRGAAQRHATAETLWRRARSVAEPELEQQYHRDMVAESGTADSANAALDEARRRAVATLGNEIDLWAPGGGSLTPVDAWRRATISALPTDVAMDEQDLLDAYNNPDVQLAKGAITNASKGALKGYQVYTVLNYLRAPSLSLKAEAKFLETSEVYQAIKGAAPDLSDPAQLKAYMKAEKAALKAFTSNNPTDVRRAQWLYQQTRGLIGEVKALDRLQLRYPGLTTAQVVGNVGKFERFMRPWRVVAPFASKVLGPVGVVMGGLDVYTALTDDTMATDDRVARGVGGVASIVGGGATALMAFGLIATGPVGLTVIAVAGVIAVGAWAYENREAIADAAKKTWNAVSDGAQAVGGAVADGAKKIWKGLFG